MRPIALSQAARWVEGRHLGAEVEFTSVGIDSRSLAPGALFVALRGERHDGHDHAAQALERGAVALLVQREVDCALPQVLCADTEEALGELAAGHHQEVEQAVWVLPFRAVSPFGEHRAPVFVGERHRGGGNRVAVG